MFYIATCTRILSPIPILFSCPKNRPRTVPPCVGVTTAIAEAAVKRMIGGGWTGVYSLADS